MFDTSLYKTFKMPRLEEWHKRYSRLHFHNNNKYGNHNLTWISSKCLLIIEALIYLDATGECEITLEQVIKIKEDFDLHLMPGQFNCADIDDYLELLWDLKNKLEEKDERRV